MIDTAIEMICDTCKHWTGDYCRRFPPVPLNNLMGGTWPMTRPDDYCGEWAQSPLSQQQEAK